MVLNKFVYLLSVICSDNQITKEIKINPFNEVAGRSAMDLKGFFIWIKK